MGSVCETFGEDDEWPEALSPVRLTCTDHLERSLIRRNAWNVYEETFDEYDEWQEAWSPVWLPCTVAPRYELGFNSRGIKIDDIDLEAINDWIFERLLEILFNLQTKVYFSPIRFTEKIFTPMCEIYASLFSRCYRMFRTDLSHTTLLKLSIFSLIFLTKSVTLSAHDIPKGGNHDASSRVHLTGEIMQSNIGNLTHEYILMCSCKGLPFGSSAEFLVNGKTFNSLRLFNDTCYSISPLFVCRSTCWCSTNRMETIFGLKYPLEQNGTQFSCRIRYRIGKQLLAIYESTWLDQKSYSRIVHSMNDADRHARRQPELEKDEVRTDEFEMLQLTLVVGLSCLMIFILVTSITFMKKHNKVLRERI